MDGSASWPSKPMARACSHSAANPLSLRKSLKTPSSASRLPARAASTICISQGRSICRSVPRLDACILDEIVCSGHETREPRGPIRGRVRQWRLRSRARAASPALPKAAVRSARRFHRARRRHPGYLAGRRSSAAIWRPAGTGARRQQILRSPFAGKRIDADHRLTAGTIVLKESAQALARRVLAIGRHCVFQIEDDRIAGEGADFRQRLLIGSRHVEDGSARAGEFFGHRPTCRTAKRQARAATLLLQGQAEAGSLDTAYESRKAWAWHTTIS